MGGPSSVRREMKPWRSASSQVQQRQEPHGERWSSSDCSTDCPVTVLYCTILYSTVLYCTVQYSTVLYSAVQYYTVQYFTVLYSTVQYCTALQVCTIDCPVTVVLTVLHSLQFRFVHNNCPIFQTLHIL